MARPISYPRLRKRRRELELPLDYVAQMLRISRTVLSLYERGFEPVRPTARQRWAELAKMYARLLERLEADSKAGRLHVRVYSRTQETQKE
ncbi:MAG: hypothetical protein KatS3mg023_3907 [Armatimonadota bacterium]|nr:MAG: hypothetical protein KatS3mg023_3907 [Armatimonadota bacterium]